MAKNGDLILLKQNSRIVDCKDRQKSFISDNNTFALVVKVCANLYSFFGTEYEIWVPSTNFYGWVWPEDVKCNFTEGG